ncbi:MAG: hypothetical protein ACFFED_17260 [Candidatus Thorarchaeota archaeon]
MHCEKCSKEVVIMGIPLDTISNDELDRITEEIEREGKLILFNPPPFRPYHCPICGSELND